MTARQGQQVDAVRALGERTFIPGGPLGADRDG
jgi:hypothetical protein